MLLKSAFKKKNNTRAKLNVRYAVRKKETYAENVNLRVMYVERGQKKIITSG